MRRLLLSTAALAAALTTACASPCDRVRADLDAFEARSGDAQRPHVAFDLPYPVIDDIVRRHVRELDPVRVPLGEIAGNSLGSAKLTVRSVRVVPSGVDVLGFVLVLDLAIGKQKLGSLDLRATTKPRLDPKRGTLKISLRGEDLRDAKANLSKNGRKTLGGWVWNQLPSAARMLLGRKQVDALVGNLAEGLLDSAVEQLRRTHAKELGELASIELDLPPLPVDRMRLNSTQAAIVVSVWTDLPVTKGVTPIRRRGKQTGPITVRVSGSTAAELVNWAMKEGHIPARYGRDGTPDEKGPLLAAVAWNHDDEDGRPLDVHLFAAEKDCAHAVLDAEPVVAVKGKHLSVGAKDAKLREIRGSAKVRAGLFFSGFSRRSFTVVEQLAASTKFDVGPETMRASIADAKLAGSDLSLAVELTGK